MDTFADGIIEQIKSGRITALTLDTSIFDQHHLNLESGLLFRLKQFKGSDNKVCFSDVVCREVQRHLTKKAENAKDALVDAAISVERAWQQPKTKELVQQIFSDRDSAQDLAERRLNEYLDGIGAIVVPQASITLDSVLDLYFAEQPPFSSQKKAEFPDAIALLALEHWANEHDTNILVVTRDKDWTEYCAQSSRLRAMSDLSAALSYFQSETAKFAAGLIEKKIHEGDPYGFGEQIKAAIKENFENVYFDPEVETDLDFVIDSMNLVDILSLTFADESQDDAFELVEAEKEELVIRIRVYPQISMIIEMSLYASDTYVGSLVVNHEQELELYVFASFTIGKIHHTLPKDLRIASVEVPEQLHFLELGEIGTDGSYEP